MAHDVLVYCELGQGQTEAINDRLLATGAELAGRLGGRLVALVLGSAVSAKAEALRAFVDQVMLADAQALALYTGEAELAVLEGVVAELEPAAILLGHTFIGMDLGPRVATRLGVGIATNCVGLDEGPGEPVFVRPMYRGRLQAKVSLATRPIVATLQHSGAAPVPRAVPGALAAVEVPAAPGRIRALRMIEPSSSGVDITKAEIVIAGGRGIGTRENYALVEQLAAVFGGVPACSRPLVDMGWFDASRQVGLSGRTVKPRLYIACGISGAMEHLHGMKESGLIVAINQDSEAPIFKVAHYGLLGDLNEIIPALAAGLAARK